MIERIIDVTFPQISRIVSSPRREARIVHIALKVDDLEKASQFYENLFGFFKDMETAKVRDHTSRHLSDGTIDLALIKYDKEESAESLASGTGPCIHHLAIEVDDFNKYVTEFGK